jgi:hypothetical protein
MFHRAAAIGLALHGFAHLVGFVSAWRLAALPDAPFTTLIFNGTLDVGDPGIRIVGGLWLVVAIAFGVAAVAVWRAGAGALRPVGLVAGTSAILCVVGLPTAMLGLGVNLAILAGLAIHHLGWPASLRPSAR